MTRLKDKTVVVTGGGSGIGLGAAQRFIDEGAFVYIFGRRQDLLDKAGALTSDETRTFLSSFVESFAAFVARFRT